MVQYKNKPIKDDTIAELRRFIKNKRTPQLYLILSVIRGPDRNSEYETKNEYEFKTVTTAIRAYLGFSSHRNCTGSTFYTPDELKPIIVKVEKEFENGTASHYVTHLYYALQAIDKNKLIDWVYKNRNKV